jgi:hypothetical protein
MNVPAILIEILRGAIKTTIIITAVLIPLMTGLEIIKDGKVLNKVASVTQPIMRLFTLPKEGAFPLFAGILFGIAFGSGLIISFSREGNLNKRDMMLICVFLAICHGMIEDPLIFAAIGASWWVIIVIRILLAFTTMLLICRIPFFSRTRV